MILPSNILYKNYFPVPNEMFLLGLSSGELAVYFYLLYRENRKTHQCWPSYKTIGKAVGMSKNTVQKYVNALVDKELIDIEPTTVTTTNGIKRNGSLLYTILQVKTALEKHQQSQIFRLKNDTKRGA